MPKVELDFLAVELFNERRYTFGKATLIGFSLMKRNCDSGVLEDARHPAGLDLPLCPIVLNNAKRVNPYISDTKFPDKLNAFLKCDRQFTPNQSALMSVQISLCSLQWPTILPAVS